MSHHIFVDDTDPAIQYTGGWKVITGLNTDQAPTASRGHTPYYGTLHTPDISASSSQWGISYTFEGKGFIAYFQTISTDAIVSCTVDGKEQLRGTTLGGGAHCVWDGMTLQPGAHKLEIIVKSVQDKALFDGLEYFTDNPPSGVDEIAFYSSSGVQGSDVLKAPGDKLDYEFTGTSLAVYVSYSTTQDVLDKGPSPLQYTIDGGSPVKFTLRNPANAANPQIYPQLLIQTPKLSSGKHKFRLEFLGPGTGERSFFSLQQFIVQNSNNPGLNLEVVPSASSTDNSGNGGTQVTQSSSSASSSAGSGVSSSSSTSSSTANLSSSGTASIESSSSTHSSFSGFSTGTHSGSSSQSTSSPSPLNPDSNSSPSDGMDPLSEHHKSNKIPIIAGCVAAAALILLLLVLLFIRRKRKTASRNGQNMGIDDNLSAYPFNDRIAYANEKGKQREHEVEVEDGATDSEPGSVEPARIVNNRPQAVVYRVHEDAGEAIEPEPEEQVVIDLPPTYNTIRPAQTRSMQGPRPPTVIGPRRLPSANAKNENGLS